MQMPLNLDLSAAFDTVDHSLLLERLHFEFAVTDTSLDWLRSYLVDRAQFVKMGRHQSDTVPSTLLFHKDRCSARCYSLSTVAQWATSSHNTASRTTSMPTTR